MFVSVWPPESVGAGWQQMQRSPEGPAHQVQVMESKGYSQAGVASRCLGSQGWSRGGQREPEAEAAPEEGSRATWNTAGSLPWLYEKRLRETTCMGHRQWSRPHAVPHCHLSSDCSSLVSPTAPKRRDSVKENRLRRWLLVVSLNPQHGHNNSVL